MGMQGIRRGFVASETCCISAVCAGWRRNSSTQHRSWLRVSRRRVASASELRHVTVSHHNRAFHKTHEDGSTVTSIITLIVLKASSTSYILSISPYHNVLKGEIYIVLLHVLDGATQVYSLSRFVGLVRAIIRDVRGADADSYSAWR